jgi:pyridoxal phosphate enzyme (YggS family)
MSIGRNLEIVKERIAKACLRVGRDPAEVKLLAVSKTVGCERIKEAIECGQRLFGENYVQEALPKIRELGPGIEWHFIGHLQSNKARQVVGAFQMVQSLDRVSLAQELERRARAASTPVDLLIQVNLAREESKSGAGAEDLERLLEEVVNLQWGRLRGLMTIPPLGRDPEEARPYFRGLWELRERFRRQVPPPHCLEELSMGMTGDLEVAVEEGATIVRVGTAIFGARQIQKD